MDSYVHCAVKQNAPVLNISDKRYASGSRPVVIQPADHKFGSSWPGQRFPFHDGGALHEGHTLDLRSGDAPHLAIAFETGDTMVVTLEARLTKACEALGAFAEIAWKSRRSCPRRL
ncbi:hypothetical protein [Rhizobium sp. C1]|uniref:hypothetical protein n=1 Tax=Rhizobium sp. C1 TaxID=1349799 RepID=UPI001E2F1BF4|nr:hypothetical protein [Rhizobium sp. C1]MCD2176420.1 hypothetical protein [Rhizobium sp. C1]